MLTARKVALRINGTQVTKATLRRGEKQLELVVLDPFIGEFVIGESFTLELLELVHPHEIRSRLPDGGAAIRSYQPDPHYRSNDEA